MQHTQIFLSKWNLKSETQMMNWKQKNMLFFSQVKSTLPTTKMTFFTVKSCSRIFFLHINKQRRIGRDMFLVTWKTNWLAIGCFLVLICLYEIMKCLSKILSGFFFLSLPLLLSLSLYYMQLVSLSTCSDTFLWITFVQFSLLDM